MTAAATDTLQSGAKRTESRFPVNVDLNDNDMDVRVGRKIFRIGYAPGDVQDYNTRFIKTLEEIRMRTGKELTLSDADYGYFMKELRDIGSGAYAFLRKAGIGEYIQTLETRESDRGISLDFTFPAGMGFLWQMMYTGSRLDNPVQEEKFWGFHYPIGNLFWDSETSPRIKLKDGIFASAHEELKSSLEELNSLENLLKQVRAQINRNVMIQRVDEAISCDMLCSDDLFRYFNREDFEYGVVHFACHCVNPAEGAAQAYLLMTAKQTNLELTLEMFNTLAEEECRFQCSPLVFLNACESQTPLHFLQSLNFPSGLINFGAGGVIATACTMPDYFANAFAAEFYDRLLKKPLAGTTASIGETLMETSYHFLKTKKNPLGLAYGLYAISNQEFKLE
jgi:hypothetical protein